MHDFKTPMYVCMNIRRDHKKYNFGRIWKKLKINDLESDYD